MNNEESINYFLLVKILYIIKIINEGTGDMENPPRMSTSEVVGCFLSPFESTREIERHDKRGGDTSAYA